MAALVATASTGAAPACMMMGDHLPAAAPLIQPEPQPDLPTPPIATDDNPDPNIVEVRLTAAPTTHAYLSERPASAWAYNGSVPGPTIEAHRGDTVIVHFKNDLPEATTIHWHGVRVPNNMDGAGRLLQPVPTGGTFDYQFVVPDDGTFWYHPHVRTDIQVDKGLYGAIVVRDADAHALDVGIERILILDDVSVDPNSGQPTQGFSMRAMMMGREGNLLLVNGQPSNGAIDIVRGQRVRLRLVNAANSRFFQLRLDGAPLTQIGSDGGDLPAPRAVGTVLLAPGERADLVFEASGSATLVATPYERAHGAGASEESALVRFVLSGAPPITAAALPSTLRTIEVLPSPSVRQTLRLDDQMAHHAWRFTINGQVFPNVPPIAATLGTRQLWSVQNDSDMDHPFHLHGFFFQQSGLPEWKDTINVPARSTRNLVVDFAERPDATGDWMYHCHILEHAEGGMMGEVQVR